MPFPKQRVLRVATRESTLALAQTSIICQALQRKHPDMDIELVKLSTHGDRVLDKALNAIGGKSLFCKELQQALLDNQADIAVHSIKDMSAHPHPYLILAGIYQRDDPRDAFISPHYNFFHQLPGGASVGTSSPRRKSLLQAIRSDITIELLRGNVETRLRKLEQGQYDAIVLAAAGLNRLHFSHHIKHFFDPEQFIPAVGQGAIGIECRFDDKECIELLRSIDHLKTRQCIRAERAVIRKLNGDCFTPLGAHAVIKKSQLQLRALVANQDGSRMLSAEISGAAEEAEQLGEVVADNLLQQGAAELLQH